MARITKRTADAAKPGDLIWDKDLPGFGIRCQRKAVSYLLKYRFRGKQRWYTIGQHGKPWSPDAARKEAKRLLGLVADNIDPAKVRENQKTQITISQLCDRYLTEYAEPHKKASSVRMDRKNIENHVKPLLGREFVADVTRADIDRFKRAVKQGKTARDRKADQIGGAAVTGGPGVANRCLALVSKMFNLAERWGLRPDNSNPCRHVDRYPENSRERFLSEKELATLAEVLAEAEREDRESPFIVAAIRLLTFTGARLGEILNLEWANVDFERTMLLLPDSKTGKKAVYLSAPALDVLTNIPRLEGNPFVICGNKPGAALVNLQKPWGRIRKRAGLDDVRLHDLRHSFASVAAAGGASLPIIGALLGHRESATTGRYAHLAADPLKAANEAIGQRIAAAMKGEGAEIFELGVKH